MLETAIFLISLHWFPNSDIDDHQQELFFIYLLYFVYDFTVAPQSPVPYLSIP